MHPGVTPLVEVRDANVHFGSARAVDGASLRVIPGEVLALVGESGSGKTTLIRAIQGLQPLTSGTITIEGADPVTVAPGDRGHTFANPMVQMVFQDPTGALNPRQTIYDIVVEGLRIQGRGAGEEQELVARALSRAGLRPPERFFTRYPHEISGGQRQRVVIAGAMVMEPRLLLADEPVASLDASIRGEILALMRQLVDETGLAILVVTHDLGLAWNIADRVAVMYLGRIIETGPTEQLLEDPQHPYTKALLSVVPETREMKPQILTGEIPDLRRIPSGCRFHPRCPLRQSGTLPEDVAQRCVDDDPGPIPLEAISAAACWAVTGAVALQTPTRPHRDILPEA
jgi:peptide/nickel transport system ATP-binding protein